MNGRFERDNNTNLEYECNYVGKLLGCLGKKGEENVHSILLF
jgi:hypothetical protein